MDARADSLATCGYGMRQGTIVVEKYDKVWTHELQVWTYTPSR